MQVRAVSTLRNTTPELVCSSSRDRSVRVWSPLTGDAVATLYGHNHFVGAVTALTNSRMPHNPHFPGASIASGGNDSIINIWYVS